MVNGDEKESELLLDFVRSLKLLSNEIFVFLYESEASSKSLKEFIKKMKKFAKNKFNKIENEIPKFIKDLHIVLIDIGLEGDELKLKTDLLKDYYYEILYLKEKELKSKYKKDKNDIKKAKKKRAGKALEYMSIVASTLGFIIPASEGLSEIFSIIKNRFDL